MGAGAICRGLTSDPDRFERIVLALPAAVSQTRSDASMRALGALADRVDSGDVEAVTAHLVADQPAAVQDDRGVQTWARGQAEQLLDSGVSAALRRLPHLVPVPEPAALRAVTCPVLVLAQEDDDLHPVEVAEELAGLFPSATLKIFGSGGMMWEHRARTRDLVGAFLSER